MTETIAHKAHGAGILYIVLTVIGIGGAVYGFGGKSIPLGIFGAVLAATCAAFSAKYLSLPSEMIVLSDGTLRLPKGEVLPLCDLRDVSCRQASSRGVRYHWGSVTLTAVSGRYTFDFVTDCETVAKRLTVLMLEAAPPDKAPE